MKKINKHIFLGCILVICVPAQGMLNSGRAAYRSAREKYRMVRPIQGTQPAMDAKKRLLTTAPEKKKKEQSVMRFEQPLEMAPLGSTSAVAQQEKNSFLARIKSWWYGLSQPSQTVVLSEYRVSQMFNFVLSEMKRFRTILVSKPGPESVFEQENIWLRSAMADFANKLKEEYRDVLQGQKDGYSVAGPVLLLIRDYLMTAIKNCKLGDRLILAYVFSACDLLQKLRSFGVELRINDKIIVRDIVRIINERLVDDPKLKFFLEDLNAQAELNKRLSDDDIAMIIKNSALLVPIDEVQSFNEILSAVQGVPLAISTNSLAKLLKRVHMDIDEPVLNIWKQAESLKREDATAVFQAIESAKKEEYKTKELNNQKTIEDIIAALSITDVYATVLKRLTPSNYKEENNLQEIFENAYSREKSNSEYDLHQRINLTKPRIVIANVKEYALKTFNNKSKEIELRNRMNSANRREMMEKE